MDLQQWLGRELFGGNTVEHVIRFAIGVAITAGAAKAVQLLFKGLLGRMAQRSKNQLDDLVLATFERPIYWIVLVGGVDLSLDVLMLPGRLLAILGHATTVVVTALIAWSAANFVSAMRLNYLDPLVAKSQSRLDDNLVPILERAIKATIWVMAALVMISNLGYDVMSVLTGLGLGGLALAMAAKDTLSNVFGSITILADRPFQVGDTVKMSGYTGVVEEVGLRTCRVRTLEGTLVTVPNASLVGGVIENVSERKAARFSGELGLVYSTTAEELKAAIAAVKEILAANGRVRPDFAVRFMRFADSALVIAVGYWVVPPDAYYDVVAEVNLAIKERFDADGFDMAFPSMTIYRGDVPAGSGNGDHAQVN